MSHYNTNKKLLSEKYEEFENNDGKAPFDLESGGADPLLTHARIESMGFSGVLLNLIFIPLFAFLPILTGFFTIEPQQHGIIVFWGKPISVKKTPGLYWFLPFGTKVQKLPTSTQTLDIKKTTVVDKNGNPIVVGGVVTFQLVDTLKAAFDVADYSHYLERQSLATLKRVCSMYPYECRRSGKSLQSESAEVSRLMVQLLQQKADIAGAKIVSYELADLQYAPEIASGMLVRQQAEALVEARNTIVDGAVNIVSSAVDKLRERGLAMSEREQSRMISNLLAVICGDSHVTPTFSISDNVENDSKDGAFQETTLKALQSILAALPKQSQ